MGQTDIAKALTVNQTAVSQLERGITTPNAVKLPELANLLGCTIDELYTGAPVIETRTIRALRKRADLTQVQLARLLGIRQPSVAAWEAGKKGPRHDKMPRLATVLGCTINELYGLPASAPSCEDVQRQMNLSDLDEVARRLDELTQGLIEVTQLVRRLGEAIMN